MVDAIGRPDRLDPAGVLVGMPKVEVRVAVWHPVVMVMVGMHEVGREQSFVITEQVGWCIVGHNCTVLEDVCVVGDVGHGVEVVGGGDDGFAGIGPTDQEVDDHALAFGVKGSGRFIQ